MSSPPPVVFPRAPWWRVPGARFGLPALVTLYLGGAAAIFVVVLTIGAGTILRRHLERQLGRSFETLAQQVADKLDRTLYERTRQLLFTSHLAPFRDGAASETERRTALDSLSAMSADYAWVGFADAAGTVRLATSHLFEGEVAVNTPWFRGAAKRLFVGSLREIPELARTVPHIGDEPPRFVDLAVPVTAANGQFLGILGAQLHWGWARDIQLSVVPDLARRERLGVTLYSVKGEILHDSGGSGWTEPPEAPAGITTRPGAHGSSIEHTAGGTVYLTAYSRSAGFGEYQGLGWLAVVRQPVEEAFAPVRELRNRMLAFGAGLVALLAGFSWFVASRIDRRLRAIATAAGRIGQGDITTLIPLPQGNSQLDRTCAALGDLVEKFRTRQETLEKENARLAASRAPTKEKV